MKIIAFEGPDCLGKTSQMDSLYRLLREKGFSVSSFKIPFQGDFVHYSTIKNLLETRTVKRYPLLFQAAMVENRKEFQELHLKNSTKDFVLVDRWNLSTLFYGEAQGIPMDLTKKMIQDILPSDVTFIFDGVSFVRESRDVLDEDEELQKKVRSLYENFHGRNVFHINANLSFPEVSRNIWNYFQTSFSIPKKCTCGKEMEFTTKNDPIPLRDGKTFLSPTLGWWCPSCGRKVLKEEDL